MLVHNISDCLHLWQAAMIGHDALCFSHSGRFNLAQRNITDAGSSAKRSCFPTLGSRLPGAIATACHAACHVGSCIGTGYVLLVALAVADASSGRVPMIGIMLNAASTPSARQLMYHLHGDAGADRGELVACALRRRMW